MTTHVCPSCGGRKTIIAAHALMSDGSSQFGKVLPCFKCDSTGKISEQHFRWYQHGQQMRAERIARGVGLRQEAERRGMLPSDLCDMENGKIEPKPIDAEGS